MNKDEKMWGMLCHLSAIIGVIGIPFGFLIGPLVIYLLKKDEYPFVAEQGKEALNFQISMLIYTVIAGILVLLFIGILLLGIIFVLEVVFIIIASLKANEGEGYRYPLTIRFIK
jgi:uncharacterized protein